MSDKLYNIKANKNLVVSAFPSDTEGKNGDIRFVVVQKGMVLAAKANNVWYSSNTLQDFRQQNRSKFDDITIGRGTRYARLRDGEFRGDRIKFNSNATQEISVDTTDSTATDMVFIGQKTTDTLSDGGSIKFNPGTTSAAKASAYGDGNVEIRLGDIGKVFIDKNSTITVSKTTSALHVDFDQTGIVASGQTLTA